MMANHGLARVFSVSILGGGIGRLGYFVGLTLLAWLVSPESFGRFSALYASLQVIMGVVGSSSSVASTRLAANFTSATGPTRRVLRVPLAFGVLGGVIGGAWLPWAYALLTGEPPELKTALVGCAVFLSVSCDGVLGAHAGNRRYRLVSSCEALRGALAMVSVLFTASLGPHAVVLGILACEGAVALGLWLFAPRASTEPPLRRAKIRLALAVAVTGMASVALAQVASWSLNYAISSRFGVAQMAAYNVANRFATFALVLPTLLTRNMLGRLSSLVASGGHARFSSEVYKYLWVAIALALSGGLFALLLSWWPMGPLFMKYEHARWFLVVLIVAAIPSAVGSALGVVLVSLDMRRVWLLSDFVLAMVTLMTLLILVSVNSSVVAILWALPAGQFAGTAVRMISLAWRNRNSALLHTRNEHMPDHMPDVDMEARGGHDPDQA